MIRKRIHRLGLPAAIFVVSLIAIAVAPATSVASDAAAPQHLTKELAGTELTYHYEGGRRYQVRFSADAITWLRLDVPGRKWEGPVPYVARKISPDRYFVNWRRPQLNEFITVYYDFSAREMYTSALLEGGVRHFESAKIVELKRPQP